MSSEADPHEPRLHAYLSYRDAAAALTWLEAVGFTITARHDGPDTTITHAEVRHGQIILMLASAVADYVVPPLRGASVGDGLYLWLPNNDDVDDWYTRAIAAGGQAVLAPETTEWGTRRARVLDPEGREWSVGTYQPGQSW